jgi:hypothetical protein
MNWHLSKVSFAEFCIVDSLVRGLGAKKYIGNNNSSRSCCLFKMASRNQPSLLVKNLPPDANFLKSREVVPMKIEPPTEDCVVVADAEKPG